MNCSCPLCSSIIPLTSSCPVSKKGPVGAVSFARKWWPMLHFLCYTYMVPNIVALHTVGNCPKRSTHCYKGRGPCLASAWPRYPSMPPRAKKSLKIVLLKNKTKQKQENNTCDTHIQLQLTPVVPFSRKKPATEHVFQNWLCSPLQMYFKNFTTLLPRRIYAFSWI